jgi:UDP-N-acetylglucosamine 2-epimerase (non-hydrolysing)
MDAPLPQTRSEKKPYCAIILGTRPEIIKMSPVIRALPLSDYFILHTGQHYSYNMDLVFFEDLKLPSPKFNLNVGSGSHAEETGKMLIGIEKVLVDEKPDVALVLGDTNTVLAGALAASKLGIRVGHIEAGLRSGDMGMPEEINRILTDHMADYLFAPTVISCQNLLREGINKEKIFLTGNTIVDAVNENVLLIGSRTKLSFKNYILVTLHRQENVDDPSKLKSVINGLELVSERLNRSIVYPIHPRTRKRLQAFNINVSRRITILEPQDYLTFLGLEKNADAILTDSGGVQEEACILKVPCVTLRANTERPETIEVGANILAGTDPETILEKTSLMVASDRKWRNPFGDGRASKRIIDVISRDLKQ